MALLNALDKLQHLGIHNPSLQGVDRALDTLLSFIHRHKRHEEKEGPDCFKQSSQHARWL